MPYLVCYIYLHGLYGMLYIYLWYNYGSHHTQSVYTITCAIYNYQLVTNYSIIQSLILCHVSTTECTFTPPPPPSSKQFIICDQASKNVPSWHTPNYMLLNVSGPLYCSYLLSVCCMVLPIRLCINGRNFIVMA